MNQRKREITAEERKECLALKAAIDAFNAGKQRKDSLTQGKIAEALDVSQGAVSAYLNGYNSLNPRVAGIIAGLIDIPVKNFSPRLAAEIAAMTKTSGAGLDGKAREAEAPAYTLSESYSRATRAHRQAIDDLAKKMLDIPPEQALKLKQAMDVLIPHDPRED